MTRTEISIMQLTKEDVIIKKQEVIIENLKEYYGELEQRSYVNSEHDRKILEEEVEDATIKQIVFLMWGDEPNVDQEPAVV